MQDILTQYQALLQEIDRWFAGCLEQAGEQIACQQGCYACCRGLFEISLLDACLLQTGFNHLDRSTQEQVLTKAHHRTDALQSIWP